LKTSLDHLPRRKQTELKRVVDVLFAEFDDMLKLATSQQKKRGRILKIILYGSYARGDWVEDRASGYMSDYDVLVIVNQRQLVDKAECWEKADDWFVSRRSPETQVHFFVETLHEVNDKLAQGYYFFTDIKKEGIALYELKGHTLAEPKNLSEKNAKKLSEKFLEHGLKVAEGIFDTFRYVLGQERFNEAAFNLHQTVERLYASFLLSRTLYVPNTHNIKFLRSLAEDIDPALRTVWPRDTRRERALFELLKRSYVEARYSEHFNVTEEELVWLKARAEKLQKLVTTRAPRTGSER